MVKLSCNSLTTLTDGCLYFLSIQQASLWPSIPLVVPQSTVGTAMGLTTSIQMLGIGLSNLVVGKILGKSELVFVFPSNPSDGFCTPRIVGPFMFGVSAFQFFADFKVGVVPETLQVGGDLNRFKSR